MSNKSGYVIGFILGLVISSALSYILVLQPTQQNLNAIIDREEEQINTLTIENRNLNDELEDLTVDHEMLQIQYTSKTSEFALLKAEHGTLTQKYERTYDDWVHLSEDVMDLYDTLRSYIDLEEAIHLIINNEELNKIAETIEDVSNMETDHWDACWLIHKYVRDEIKYAYDCEMPYITTYSYYPEETDTQLTGFETGTLQNYYQSLDYTVEYKQGDCDDQAVLEYAMIQYYQKYIYGTLYNLYLARISLNDGNSHMAVFMPVVDNQICILDPAGQYQTGSWNYIQSKKASTELYNYRDIWDGDGGIQEITLWRIDIDTGEYTEVFKGTFTETVAFFSD